MGELCVLCSLGDEKVTWDPEDQDSIDKAEEKFNTMLKKGHKAYRIGGDGKKTGKAITVFPPFAARVLLIPPVMGG